jgi:uncharacterized protein
MRKPLPARISAIDWPAKVELLETQGFATTGTLLDHGECSAIVALYDEDSRFRSRVNMAQHNFGMGEYKYFDYPLPKPVQALRSAFYPKLARIANQWSKLLGEDATFPSSLPAWLKHCHDAGQTRPTPLLLKYGAGGYNCLHQDLYGDLAFPFQLTILLSAPRQDFAGGEFLLTEQRPRMQSRAHVVPLVQGEAVIFPVRHRPLKGTRGYYRAVMRHGVSTIRRGNRLTLGIIFHNAR